MSRNMAAKYIKGCSDAFGEGFCNQLVVDERASSGTYQRAWEMSIVWKLLSNA